MTDTISDLLIRIKNADLVDKKELILPFSKSKLAILEVMKSEGYIKDAKLESDDRKNKVIKVILGDKKINHIRRLSRPGNRKYTGCKNIPRPLRGFGLIIISSPKGMISGKNAKKFNIGGELICEMW